MGGEPEGLLLSTLYQTSAGSWVMPLDDQIYPAQVWTIQELEGSYTIVGRARTVFWRDTKIC